jgi:arsenate reductase
VKKVFFACVENAGRNQMAEAFANKYGKDRTTYSSAGNKPSDEVNPVVVEAMREKGIDISMNKPKLLTFQMVQDADLIVTMGCNDQGICPGPFFKPTVEWRLDDPKGKPIERVREIRDDIERRVQKLTSEDNKKRLTLEGAKKMHFGLEVTEPMPILFMIEKPRVQSNIR